MRGLTEIGHSQPTTKMIKELRKELNDDEIDLSKLYKFKNKSSRSLSLEFKTEDFILATAFLWINQAILNDIHAVNDLKIISELTITILEKADKVHTPDNIKVYLDNQIEKIKNTSINVKSLAVAHENFFLYDNENIITETYVSELKENISTYGLIKFLGKTNNKDNKLHLMTPEQKLKFNLKKDAYKNKIELKLGKVHIKTLFSTP